MSVLCFCKISGKSHWTDGFLKDLNRFFFQKPRKSKNEPYFQKIKLQNFLVILKLGCFKGDYEFGTSFTVILFGHQKLNFSSKKPKKMKHPKKALRSQIDQLIKSFGYCMFNE